MKGRGRASPKKWRGGRVRNRKGGAFPQSERRSRGRSRKGQDTGTGKAEPFRRASGGAGEDRERVKTLEPERRSLSAEQAAEPGKIEKGSRHWNRKGGAFPQSERRSRGRSRKGQGSGTGKAEPFRGAGGGAGEDRERVKTVEPERRSLSAEQAAEPGKIEINPPANKASWRPNLSPRLRGGYPPGHAL